MKVVLCAILRTENRYIEEWLDYHLELGFDHVYLCDNAQGQEERVSHVISACPRFDNKVTIFPYYDKHSQQVRAYTDCYKEFGLKFDWMAFCDIDEFFTFSSTTTFHNIKDYLSEVGADADEVLINWRLYGDCNMVNDEGSSVLSRFKTPLPDNFSPYNLFGKQPFNCHVKQILRANLPLYQIMPHATNAIEGKSIRAVDGDGHRIEIKDVQPRYTFNTCFIRHFYTRTIEEYIATKISRGMGVVSKNIVYNLSDFFLYNKPTIQKYKIYKSALEKYPNQITPHKIWWLKQAIKMWILCPFMKTSKN